MTFRFKYDILIGKMKLTHHLFKFMTKIAKQNTKRYIVSSIVTFLTGMAVVLLSQWDSITLTSFTDGSILGLGFVAVRAGLKALIEYLLSLSSK